MSLKIDDMLKYLNKVDFLKELKIYNKACKINDQVGKFDDYIKKLKSKNKKNNISYDKPIIFINDLANKINECSGVRLNKITMGKNSNKYELGYKYTNKIHLPFNNCYIVTTKTGSNITIIDINLNNGIYFGSIYNFYDKFNVTEFPFSIKKEGDSWNITFDFIFKYRSFPDCFLNITSILYNGLNDKTINKIKSQAVSKEEISNLDIDIINSCFSMIPTFLYLENYKSKISYLLNKNDDQIYFITETEDSWKKVFPDYIAKELKEWIVNGYFKFIDGVGKDKDGKSVIGLDWIVPYNTIEGGIISSKNEISETKPIHAIERAKERYNIDLDYEDLQNIISLCLKRKCDKLSIKDSLGRIKTTKNCYRVNYKNTIMDFVFAKDKVYKSYRIVTFLPAPENPQYKIIDSKSYAEFISSIN